MASTNSSVGITINIVCKEVQYDFSDFPDYDFIRQAAISAVQKEYAERQREEDEEIEDMLNDGSLSSADDFDRAYGEPFDPNKCEQRIVEVTEMYCRNVADLPKRVVVEVDSRLSADENTLKKAIEDKFGVPVKSIQAHDIARESDIQIADENGVVVIDVSEKWEKDNFTDFKPEQLRDLILDSGIEHIRESERQKTSPAKSADEEKKTQSITKKPAERV